MAPLEQALAGGIPWYIDVTATDGAREVSITKAIAEIADNRAVIEQAKGVLMYVYQVDADAAFDVLNWRSRETKVKLCALAEQLLADIRTLGHDDGSRSYGSIFEFDRLLLTTHERMESQSSEEIVLGHCRTLTARQVAWCSAGSLPSRLSRLTLTTWPNPKAIEIGSAISVSAH